MVKARKANWGRRKAAKSLSERKAAGQEGGGGHLWSASAVTGEFFEAATDVEVPYIRLAAAILQKALKDISAGDTAVEALRGMRDTPYPASDAGRVDPCVAGPDEEHPDEVAGVTGALDEGDLVACREERSRRRCHARLRGAPRVLPAPILRLAGPRAASSSRRSDHGRSRRG